MKIAFAEKFLFSIPRGIERTTFNLANAMSTLGHDVTLVTPKVENRVNAVEPYPSVEVHEIPIFRYYQDYHLIPFYLSDFSANRYDMIFISFGGYGEGVAARIAYRLWKQRYCIHLHFPVDGHEYRYNEFKQHDIAKHAETIFAASQYVADQGTKYFDRECIPNPNGVNIQRFLMPMSIAEVKDGLGYAADEKIILSVAALDERKGIQKVLAALNSIKAECKQVKYIVLGEGSYRGQLEQMIIQHDLQSCVELKGYVSDVLPYYQAADVFVLLADREANSISIYEAWACGTPVVTEQGDAYQEVVKPQFGLMVDGSDECMVAESILHFLKQNEAEQKETSQKTRRYVEQNFTWSVAAQNLLRQIT